MGACLYSQPSMLTSLGPGTCSSSSQPFPIGLPQLQTSKRLSVPCGTPAEGYLGPPCSQGGCSNLLGHPTILRALLDPLCFRALLLLLPNLKCTPTLPFNLVHSVQ